MFNLAGSYGVYSFIKIPRTLQEMRLVEMHTGSYGELSAPRRTLGLDMLVIIESLLLVSSLIVRCGLKLSAVYLGENNPLARVRSSSKTGRK